MAYSKEENSIVERANKEVLRHLRCILHHTSINTQWKAALPFVQRIMNATVHRTIGVAPAQLVFGNIDLNRQLLPDESSSTTNDLSTYISDKLTLQNKIIQLAQSIQSGKQAKHMATQSPLTEFPVNSWVWLSEPVSRMKMRTTTKLDLPWSGPFHVSKIIGSKYEIFDPFSGKYNLVHISRLKQFLASESSHPMDTVLGNNKAYIIDKVIKHKGSIKLPHSLSFLVVSHLKMLPGNRGQI
jgi:hypothetical protein